MRQEADKNEIEDFSTYCVLKDASSDFAGDEVQNRIVCLAKHVAAVMRERSSQYREQLLREDDADSQCASNQLESFLCQVLEMVAGKSSRLMAVLEYYHIDPSYRDLYYNYYSSKHFDINRFSVRLSLFETVLDGASFTLARSEDLSAAHVGCIVVNPLGQGLIGRTLLDPAFMLQEKAEVRLSEFETTVRGKKISVKAFPYRKQDGEAMRCAEVSLLNLLCYYSNEYNDYSMVLPSRILELEERYSHERVTPSKGIEYSTFSRIIAQLGFSPRLYSIEEVGASAFSGLSNEDRFKRLLHWYVCSGIPVAVNVCPDMMLEDSHSLLCIGHSTWTDGELAGFADLCAGGSADNSLQKVFDQALEKAYFVEKRSGTDRSAEKSCTLLHSADFSKQYVVIDDNQLPYAVRSFDEMSSFQGLKCANYAVPLHRSMVMDALDAYDNAIAILGHDSLGMLTWAEDYLDDGETVVLRMFMASVRRYKQFRVETSPQGLKTIYEEIPLPHFVWVFELYKAKDFFLPRDEQRAFAELVLDATSAGIDNPASKMLLLRYPDKLLYRAPDGCDVYFGVCDKNAPSIRPFDANLKEVNGERHA